MRKILLAALAFTTALMARAQTFTNVIAGSGIPVDRTWVHGVLDYNKDGFEDLLLSLGTSMPNDWNKRVLKIYKNNGNGTFSDQTTQAGLPEIDSIATFVGVADFNNDGFKDIITVEANNKIRILCGSGSGTFEDKTNASGMSLSNVTELFSPKLADLDKDGLIDLIGYTGTASNVRTVGFVKNKFNSGGQSSGFTELLPSFPSNYDPSFQLFDYDSDNDLDLFLLHAKLDYPWPGGGYYYHPIKTYQNNGGAFSEVSTVSPIQFAAIGFYPNFSDYDQDGKFDIMSGKGDFAPNSSLFLPALKNNGNGSYSDVSSVLNFSSGSCYQSPPVEIDYDLDGDVDYYQGSSGFGGCNGSWFFQNNNGAFAEVSNSIGVRLNTGSDPNGAVGHPAGNFFDFDNDGDLDFFGSSTNWGSNTSTSCFMLNNQSSGSKWLKLDLNGCQSGKDGYYASVMLKASNKKLYRIKYPFKGDAWAQSQLIHFGLGNAGTIDSLVVKWPSGQTTVLTNVAVNQTLTINEDNSCNAVSTNCPDLSGSLLEGLVGYWPFCGNANDESVNNLSNNSGGLQYSTDRFGNPGSSLRFLNDTNTFLTSNIPYAPNVTIGFWLKQNYPVTDFPVPFYFHNGNYAGSEYTFYCNSSHVSFNFTTLGVRLGTDIGTPPSNWFDSSIPYSGNDSSWNHITVTIDNINKVLSIYKNSVLSGTLPFQGQIKNFSKINFGHARKGNAQERYVGKLDDIAIWNRALTPQEITQLYYQNICTQSITVTDTLLIHTTVTSWNPVTYANTVKVWPNPAASEGPATSIILDAGNLSLMQGWKIRVSNAQGVQKYPSGSAPALINQQQQILDISSWGGNGVYFLYLIDPQNNIQEVKKIMLAP